MVVYVCFFNQYIVGEYDNLLFLNSVFPQITIKKLYMLIEMAAQGEQGGAAEAIYSGQEKIKISHFYDCLQDVVRYQFERRLISFNLLLLEVNGRNRCFSFAMYIVGTSEYSCCISKDCFPFLLIALLLVECRTLQSFLKF